MVRCGARIVICVQAVMRSRWLSRCLLWMTGRIGDLRNGHRAIRIAPRHAREKEVERLLASRALHRLTYGEFLNPPPEPVGDFARGRQDRLARAELEGVGLRP